MEHVTSVERITLAYGQPFGEPFSLLGRPDSLTITGGERTIDIPGFGESTMETAPTTWLAGVVGARPWLAVGLRLVHATYPSAVNYPSPLVAQVTPFRVNVYDPELDKWFTASDAAHRARLPELAVFWGDGSSEEIFDLADPGVTVQHEYAAAGEYVVTIRAVFADAVSYECPTVTRVATVV